MSIVSKNEDKKKLSMASTSNLRKSDIGFQNLIYNDLFSALS
jgi:hypothetical protein